MFTDYERESPPWFDDGIRSARRQRRSLERRWRHTKLEIHKQMYRPQCDVVSAEIDKARNSYYRSEIQKNMGDSRTIFSVVSQLLRKQKLPRLPSHNDQSKWTSWDFRRTFFQQSGKITSELKKNWARKPGETEASYLDGQLKGTQLDQFNLTSIEEFRELRSEAPAKTCHMDPKRTWLLKLPAITTIVNLSLES